jgi:hypothetical protein
MSNSPTKIELPPVGAKVHLKSLVNSGLPGTVIRHERGRAVVYWRDMDWWSRHLPAALIVAELPKEPVQQP